MIALENTFRVLKEGLSTVNMGYGCSIAQLRAILGRKAKTYLQDIGEGCDKTEYPIRRYKNGSIKIGCQTFTKSEVAAARKWLRTQKGK